MIRLHSRIVTGLFTLLVSLFSIQSIGQSHPPEEILKWENDIAAFDSLNRVESADAGTLLVTGSSCVRMWDSIHSDLAPYQVMQRGYGGAKLTDYNYYADRIIKAQQFKAIVVFVANDIHGGEGDRSPQEMYQSFKALVKQIRQQNPETPVCWIETTPTPSRWHVNEQVREANDLIRAYCGRNDDLFFIATFDQYITPEGLPDSTFFREDMLHMNRLGYLHWAEIIKASLEDAGINP
jgi:lysophospholipase L1-like esterase